MTLQEFNREYQKLSDTYPQHFESEFRKKAIADFVVDLDYRFWASLVNRILVSGDPRLDIMEAAHGERNAKRRARDTLAYLDLQKSLGRYCTDNGLENVVESLGIKSLSDVISKPDWMKDV